VVEAVVGMLGNISTICHESRTFFCTTIGSRIVGHDGSIAFRPSIDPALPSGPNSAYGLQHAVETSLIWEKSAQAAEGGTS
jgi:hypothetical protein